MYADQLQIWMLYISKQCLNIKTIAQISKCTQAEQQGASFSSKRKFQVLHKE